jgi:hypothetical protein
MPGGNYYPRNDQDLEAFLATFLTKLVDVMAELTLPATFDDALIAADTAFSAALGTHVASQAQAMADRQAKDTAQTSLIAALVAVVNQLRGNPGFTDDHAVLLGLPAHDTTPTPIVPGSEVPTLSVDTSAPQHHEVVFVQLTGVGLESIAKPDWARACRIMHAIVATGEPAPPIEEMTFLATDTSNPYGWNIPGAHVGKDVWYRGAWETPRGEVGNWSDPAKGTVTG